jgi:hypothetical protein
MTTNRRLPPTGETEVRVAKCYVEAVPWRVFSDNPDGDALRLVLEVGPEFELVRQDVSLGNIGLLTAIGKAFGSDRYRLVPEELVGRRARIVVTHVDTKRGTVAAVARWITDPPAPPQASQPLTLAEQQTRAKRATGRRREPGQDDLCW